mmetsp:Transcript_33721/g.96880  ORF Transcript_33721/g.96880 Transcript_33721/m.96880 type:complete len:182 (+) Transcript_33721:136-681(+)
MATFWKAPLLTAMFGSIARCGQALRSVERGGGPNGHTEDVVTFEIVHSIPDPQDQKFLVEQWRPHFTLNDLERCHGRLLACHNAVPGKKLDFWVPDGSARKRKADAPHVIVPSMVPEYEFDIFREMKLCFDSLKACKAEVSERFNKNLQAYLQFGGDDDAVRTGEPLEVLPDELLDEVDIS